MASSCMLSYFSKCAPPFKKQQKNPEYLMMKSLEYENQIFLDCFHEDGLLVMAKGLGVDRIFQSFLKVYCDPANLVFVLNTNTAEEQFFIEQLERENIKPLPKVITNEIHANERYNVYMQGGVFFITSRILVVDLLTDRVPVDLVSGIMVYKAHRIVESCQEAFILRLYRQKNKKGFIKAFSDSPHSFTRGFAHVERTMKNLFVKKLFLWPRFHASVVANLEQHKIDVTEIHIQLTSAMLACQSALLDLINACINELKRCTTAIDTEEITVENAIGKSFDQTIRLQLDPVWHQLGFKTKQLVSDLKTLRLILRHLTQYDCLTFFSMVNSVRTSEKTFGQNTGWLFLDAADSLFVEKLENLRNAFSLYSVTERDSGVQYNAKERVYGPENKKKSVNEKDQTEPVLEECPKWQALQNLLKEIHKKTKNGDSDFEDGRVLIAAEDDRTCSQLKEMLCEGPRSMLVRLYNKSIATKGQQVEDESKAKKAKFETSSKGKSKGKDNELTLTQMIGNTNGKNDADEPVATTSEADEDIHPSSADAYYGVIEEPVTVIHPLHGGVDPNGLTKTLLEFQPRHIILYDTDMQFVRELEVFKASNPSIPICVYFMMYTGSVEEQRYLTTLRLEKEAFEFLIKEKANMVVPEERDGKLEDDTNLSRDITPANATVNTRKGGIQKSSSQQKVIVDMREFRSELPSLIHRRGIDIEPVTLEIGDYILTPDICVERKSLSDLIGSLNSGRLYNQSVAMCRHYKRPVLLIEFDANKSFALQVKHQMSSEVSLQDVTSRLALLTLHFPKLRILWCHSPYATAEIFEELKLGREQPDATTAMTVSSENDSMEWSDRYSHGPQDFLLKMPGVNVKNYRRIMNKVNCLMELSTLTEESLSEVMGSASNAKLLYNFMHFPPKAPETVDKSSKSSSATGNFRRGFKRKK